MLYRTGRRASSTAGIVAAMLLVGSLNAAAGVSHSVPDGVSAVAGDGSITISWNAVNGARSYHVYYDEDADNPPYDPDAVKFVCNAIAPAEISRIRMNEADRTMELIVNDDQLSLAIGKKGQNVRLASKLTGWRLDIISESELMRRSYSDKTLLRDIPLIADANAEVLKNYGVETAEDFLAMPAEQSSAIPGFSQKDVEEMRTVSDYFLKLQLSLF